MFVSLVNSAQVHCSRKKSTFTAEKKKKMRRRKRGIQTAPILATISAVPRAYKLEQIRTDFLQTCLQQLLQIGTGVKHLLTLMLTALGRVFSSNTPLLPLGLSPKTTASLTTFLSSSSSTARWLHLCFS